MQDREDLKSGTDSREEIDNRSRNTENSSSYVENITHRKPGNSNERTTGNMILRDPEIYPFGGKIAVRISEGVCEIDTAEFPEVVRMVEA